ncbi:MAG: glycosyltransferase family 39 protein [Anaerolineae bacterium]
MKLTAKFLSYEVAAAGLTLLAFFLRIITLEDRPLTIDEFGAVKVAAVDSTLFIATNYHTTNHVLAQILARWAGLIDYSLFFLRLPSLWAGVLSVPLLYRLGRSLLGPLEGTVAALLLALAPLHIGYSQEVRGYAALVLGTLFLFYCARHILDDGRWRYWTGFSLAVVLTPYAHLFGVVPAGISGFLLSCHLWRGGRWRERALRRKISASGLLIAVGGLILFTPLAISILHVLRGGEWSGNIDPLLTESGFEQSALRDYGRLFLALTPGGDFRDISSLAFAGLALLGGIGLIRRRSAGALWLILWLLVPPLSTALALEVFRGFYAYRRFFIFMTPAYFLIMAVAIVWLGDFGGRASARLRRVWIAGTVLVLLAFFGWGRWQTFQDIVDNRWQETARYLAATAAPEDRVICEAYGRWGQTRAAHRDECFRELVFRLEEAQLKQGLAARPAVNLEIDQFATLQNIESHPQIAFGPGGVWLVLWHGDWPPPDLSAPPSTPGAQATRLGSNLLIESRARPRLAENTLASLEMLLAVENQPGDQFLYRLNLAQLHAALGQLAAAQAALDEAQRTAPEGMDAPGKIRQVEEALQRVAAERQALE